MNSMNRSFPALKRAITIAGSQSALGRKLGRSQALVYKWLNSANPLGPAHCSAIERVTGGAVTRRDLRPDDWQEIWPELAGRLEAGHD